MLTAFQRFFEEGRSVDSLAEDLSHIVDKTESNINNIIRTETTKISNNVRLRAYRDIDNKSEGIYKLVNPKDKRTDRACKEVIRKQGKGLPLEELLTLMQNESKKYFPEWKFDRNNPAMHYNSRSVIVMVRR